MSDPEQLRIKLEPLDIKCTSSDCGNGLHCFKATKKMLEQNEKGQCRSCKADLVDWKRLEKLDGTDSEHTVRMLELEMIRHHFRHVDLDQRAINHARRKGKTGIREATEKRIRKTVGIKNLFDGQQTPKIGNVICYAQHATATCCRKCIEEWYQIDPDRSLSEQEIQYFSKLCMDYIDERLPQLTEQGEKVPPIRKKSSSNEGPQ